METYLRLHTDDRKKLNQLAYSKQLSLSTVINIITKHYYVICHHLTDYLNSGNILTHVKIRNENKNKINGMICTNCIRAYYHPNELQQNYNFNKLNRSIQSELDKTFDPNWQKNLEIRIAHRVWKGKI